MKQNADHEAVAALIGDLTRAMVDRPEQVRLNVMAGTTVTLLEVAVAPGDTGKLVGRGGRSATAVRQLLFAIGGRAKVKYTLEVLEPNMLQGDERRPVNMVQDGRGEFGHGHCTSPTIVRRASQLHTFEHDPVRTTGDLLERVARELVDHTDQVEVRVLAGAQTVVYEIHLDQRDVPRLLGKGGRTIDALREIALNLGKKAGRKFFVEVAEPVEKVG